MVLGVTTQPSSPSGDGRREEEKVRPRNFNPKDKARCWQAADVVPGRHPDRWRFDSAGNVVCKRFINCQGCLCFEYDHIIPYSKGGESVANNCQILQTRVNRFKSDKERVDKKELEGFSCDIKFSENIMESRSEKEKTYIHWTTEMDRTLSNVLLEEHSKGHKSPNGWKAVAFTAAIKGMKDILGLDFSKEKIMARLKTWNKYYKEISAMLDTSGFGWDWERNMVKVDSEEVWANYVRAHPNVRHYRDKVIINWGDLGILCGNDRATGSFAATANETVAALDDDSVGEQSHIAPEPSSGGVEGSRKRKRKATPAEAIATAIGKMSVSLEHASDAIRTSGEPRVVSPPLVYEALANLPVDMPVNEIVRAMDLLGSSQHKFDTFLALPEHMRVAWLHLQFYGP